MAEVLTSLAVQVERFGRFLAADLGSVHDVLSWAVHRGGRSGVRYVIWHQVFDPELPAGFDPRLFIREKLRRIGYGEAVGLLTSAELDDFVSCEERLGRFSARCIATVGLTNTLRAGDPPLALSKPMHTINLLCRVSEPLAPEAQIEAVALMSESRAAALMDAKISSTASGRHATGTGTDCNVIAAPLGRKRITYAGKHTDLGFLIGKVVYDAVADGICLWRKRHP